MPLSRQFVSHIHLRGGTILGTSRGGADMAEIVHRIKLWGLDMVFVIGGNGAVHRVMLSDSYILGSGKTSATYLVNQQQ